MRLRAAIAESESKEAQLRSNVAVLGSRVSTLDKQLRCDTFVQRRSVSSETIYYASLHPPECR